MNFNADPKWKEHFEEKKKYEVWQVWFSLQLGAITVGLLALAFWFLTL